MKKISFLMINYLNVLMNRKNVILIITMAILVNIFCLSGSGIIGFSTVDYMKELPNVLNSYYNYYFSFCNLVVIITAVLVNIISLNKVLNNNSEYMFLTGGIKRSHVIIGQICGIFLGNLCIYMLVWCINTVMVIIFELGSVDFGVFVNTLYGCLNSILVVLVSLLILILSKSVALSFSSIVAYIGYNLYFNNSIIYKGAENSISKVIHAIFPAFDIVKVSPEEIMEVIYTYKVTNQLEVYYGFPYFIIYVFTITFICIILYDRVDL